MRDLLLQRGWGNGFPVDLELLKAFKLRER